jgi:hypothetical protein
VTPESANESEILLDRNLSYTVTKDHGTAADGIRELDVNVSPKTEEKPSSAGVNWNDHADELLALSKQPLPRAGADGIQAQDPVFARMAQLSGFNAKPHHDPLDPSQPVLWHGFGDKRLDDKRGLNADKYADQFENGDFHVAVGNDMSGFYTAPDERTASTYSPKVMPMQLRPGSKTATIDDLEAEALSLPSPWREIIAGDAGRMANYKGVDAVQARGGSVVITNRGALNVGKLKDAGKDEPSPLPPSPLPAPKTPPGSPGSPVTSSVPAVNLEKPPQAPPVPKPPAIKTIAPRGSTIPDEMRGGNSPGLS